MSEYGYTKVDLIQSGLAYPRLALYLATMVFPIRWATYPQRPNSKTTPIVIPARTTSAKGPHQ
jgi:hypothetical protein